MPATKLARANRYFDPGITKVIYLPLVANVNAPTRAEINAGTDLSDDVNDIDGWTVSSGTIDTPDLGSRFTSKIGGRLEVDDSSLTMYGDLAGVDVRALLPRGTTGYVLWADGGDVAGRKADVYPIEVISNGKNRSVGDDAKTLTVQVTITAPPAENVTIPA